MPLQALGGAFFILALFLEKVNGIAFYLNNTKYITLQVSK